MAEETATEGVNTNTTADLYKDGYTEDAGSSPKDLPLVRNYGLEPVINFSFMLRVEGIYDLPCRSIKSFHRENEFEYIQEGGLNDYVHLRRKPITKPFTFQVERYVGVDWIDPLPMGAELILPVLLFVNKYRFSNASFKPARTYAFTGCTVTAKDYGELDAEHSGLLTEITTIAYREMICVDMPSQAGFMDMEAWEFDGKAREGKNTRYYNRSSVNSAWEKGTVSKENMEKAARLWKFEKDSKKGAGKPSARYHKDEASESAMSDRARSGGAVQGTQDWAKTPAGRLWPSYQSAKRITEFLDK